MKINHTRYNRVKFDSVYMYKGKSAFSNRPTYHYNLAHTPDDILLNLGFKTNNRYYFTKHSAFTFYGLPILTRAESLGSMTIDELIVGFNSIAPYKFVFHEYIEVPHFHKKGATFRMIRYAKIAVSKLLLNGIDTSIQPQDVYIRIIKS